MANVVKEEGRGKRDEKTAILASIVSASAWSVILRPSVLLSRAGRFRGLCYRFGLRLFLIAALFLVTGDIGPGLL